MRRPLLHIFAARGLPGRYGVGCSNPSEGMACTRGIWSGFSGRSERQTCAQYAGLSKLHRLSPLRFLGLVVTRKSSNLGELRLRKSTRRGPPDKYLPRSHTQHGTLESGGRWGTGEEHAVYSTRLAARRDMRIAGKRRYLPSRAAQVSLSKIIAFAESSARNRTDEP